MEQRQMWIATAAVILTVIGGTWSVTRNMATRDDVARVRAEIQANREAAETRFDQMQDELQTEIRAAQESANSQMEELRGYIVRTSTSTAATASNSHPPPRRNGVQRPLQVLEQAKLNLHLGIDAERRESPLFQMHEQGGGTDQRLLWRATVEW